MIVQQRSGDFKYFLNKVRVFLNEGVGESTLVDAINNKKYLYLYYAGDDTIMRGYRIVKPYTLGKTKKGDTVLRAWQIEGLSDSNSSFSPKRRLDHEYFITNTKDEKGTEKTMEVSGWRLFRVDKISKVLPKGTRFDDIPPYYNPNDKQMVSIIASSPLDKGADVDYEKGTVDRKKTVKYGSKINKEIIKKDVEELYRRVVKVSKRPASRYFVFHDNKGGFDVTTEKQYENIPEENKVGNLSDLYYDFVLKDKPRDEKFFGKMRNDLKNEFGY